MSHTVKPRRVGIIGLGHVGSHVAYSLAIQGVCEELYLADIDEGKAKSQSIDLQDAVTYMPHRVTTKHCAVDNLIDCDAIVLSAGPLPDSNESRLHTLPRTMAVLGDIIERLNRAVMPTFTGFFVCISNPADVVAAYMYKALQLPAKRIICTGTCLDSARLQALLSREMKEKVSPAAFQSAMLLGEHGDSCIVAWSHVQIGNKSLDELQREHPEHFPSFDRAALQEEVHRRGYHVLSGKGSTEFGIATACAEILKAMFHNEKKVLPCSVWLNGQYGETDVFASVPVVLGANGVEFIIELTLTPEEKEGFHKSCDIIRSYIKQACEIRPL